MGGCVIKFYGMMEDLQLFSGENEITDEAFRNEFWAEDCYLYNKAKTFPW